MKQLKNFLSADIGKGPIERYVTIWCIKNSQQVYAAQFTGTQGMDTPISLSIANEKKILGQLTSISCLCLYMHNT